VIKKTKARLQNRRGSSLIQVYYDLYKLFSKNSVVSPTVSWIFHAAPYIYFASTLAAAALLPIMNTNFAFADIFILIYLLAMGRFFLALGSLDTGSAFGGMGSSRELYLSVLIEPALLLSILTVIMRGSSSDLFNLYGTASNSPFSLPYIFAAVAFVIVLVAESGRIPVDNPDTHLELTMIHEGMELEYSGRYLGLISLASAIKQTIYISLFGILFIPWQGLLPFKILCIAILLAFIETSTNKMRLFKLPSFLAVSGLLSLLALISQ
jgi:formate hydrogenlyase subunit 4